MASQGSPEAFPLWFPIFFVALWLTIGALLSWLSGWPTLAQRFRAGARPRGQALKGQVMKFGSVSERRVTHMLASAEGLYLWSNPLFRFLRPPLLLPWTAIMGVSEVKLFWWKAYELNVADITTIRITRRAHNVLRPFLRVPSAAA